MTDLEDLDIAWTRITDSGLRHLAGLRKLQSLNLHATKVSDVGVMKLQELLPNCRVVAELSYRRLR
jgi:hypothetical protein